MALKVFLFNNSRIDYQWSSYGNAKNTSRRGRFSQKALLQTPCTERGRALGFFILTVSLVSFIMKHQFLKIRLSLCRGLLDSKEPETEQQRECETERSLASLWGLFVCLVLFLPVVSFGLVFGVTGHVLLSVDYLQPLGTLELRFCLSKMQISLGLEPILCQGRSHALLISPYHNLKGGSSIAADRAEVRPLRAQRDYLPIQGDPAYCRYRLD